MIKILLINIFLIDLVKNEVTEQDKADRKIEEEALETVNKLRKDPSGFISIMEKYKDDNSVGDYKIGYDEVISQIKNLEKMDEFQSFLGIKIAAYEHSVWMNEKSKLSHTGKNGSTFIQRMEKYGTLEGGMAENIISGVTKGEKSIIDWIIDGNVPSRGHRINILNKNYKAIGIGCKNGYCTMNLSGNYINKEELKNSIPGSSFIYFFINILILLFIN